MNRFGRIDVTMAFQPIVRLAAGGAQPFAFEALARVRGARGPAMLLHDADRRGRLAELVLEGVETAATADAARVIGVPLAQGFWYGRAREAMHWKNDSLTLCAA